MVDKDENKKFYHQLVCTRLPTSPTVVSTHMRINRPSMRIRPKVLSLHLEIFASSLEIWGGKGEDKMCDVPPLVGRGGMRGGGGGWRIGRAGEGNEPACSVSEAFLAFLS